MEASRLTSCKTRDFSVLYSKDLITLNVKVADVFGLERLVRMSEISPSPDMISTSRSNDPSGCQWGVGISLPTHLFSGVIGVMTRAATLFFRSGDVPSEGAPGSEPLVIDW